MRMITFYECPIRTKCEDEKTLPFYEDPLCRFFHCDYGRKTCLINIDLDKIDTPTLFEIIDGKKQWIEFCSPEELSDIYKYGRFDFIMKEIKRRRSCSECIHKDICKYQDKYNEFVDKLQATTDELFDEESDIFDFDVMPICNKFAPGEVYR